MARSVSRLVLAAAGLMACCLVGAGCGSGATVADQPTGRDEPNVTAEPILVPVPVPIAVPITVNWPTNLDLLRAACPPFGDAEIIDWVVYVDNAWYAGMTYQEQISANRGDCADVAQFNACTYCLDSIVDFVYFVVH